MPTGDESVNSHSRKIQAQKQFLAFHGITIHFSEIPFTAIPVILAISGEITPKFSNFALKIKKIGKTVIHRFHDYRKW